MRSYEEAKAHFLRVVPLKSGRCKGEKPLGIRRYTRALIRMDDDVVVCSFYTKDVVKYLPSGEIHLDLCGYNTASTREFIYNTTRITATVSRGKPFIQLSPTEKFLFPESGVLVVKDRKVMNPQHQVVYRVNRKAMNDVRKKYADFIEYCKTMGAVLEHVTDEDVRHAGGVIQDPTDSESRLKQLMFSDPVHGVYYRGWRTERSYMEDMLKRITHAQETQDYEQMSARFMQLAVSNMYFHPYARKWVTRVKGEPVSLYALGSFDEVLKYVHRDEVFVAKEVPLGEVSGTTNQRYFSL
jgi:hypothetical protein